MADTHDDWSEEVFEKLAALTWNVHLRTTDDEEMPALPTIEDVRHAMVEGELEEALPEFIHRIQLIVAALPVPSLKFPDVILPSTYLPEARYGWMLARLLMLKELSRLALKFEDCHKLWCEARQFQKVKHPLSSLILAWFMRPLPIEPSRKKKWYPATLPSSSRLPTRAFVKQPSRHDRGAW